ncbi:MAG: hypothetical protein JWN17_1324 [Frankiales bacterium]|nr:hypothetical protein [Frankiales bacterium]
MTVRGQARGLLLQAAVALFAERGYDRTTTRDVAERAGVDASLIARYYGGKDGLYLAALREETGDGPAPDLLQPRRLRALVERVDARGGGPVFRTVVEAHEDPAVQAAAVEALRRRLVDPLRLRYQAEGVPGPLLRAETVAAAVAGVLLARSAGTFAALAGATVDELVEVLAALFPEAPSG